MQERYTGRATRDLASESCEYCRWEVGQELEIYRYEQGPWFIQRCAGCPEPKNHQISLYDLELLTLQREPEGSGGPE